MMKLADFDYELPPRLIAQHPAARRDDSRLLVVPAAGEFAHRRFPDILELLRPGDLLVRNVTRVFPARLIGRRDSGGRVELLLLRPLAEPGIVWQTMARPARPLRPGKRLLFGELTATVARKLDDGTVAVAFDETGDDFFARLQRVGRMPLPPYIARKDAEDPAVIARDKQRYQTVYARETGAVAAPTAGLHFTGELFAAAAARGVEIAEVTLHVAAGTFLPVRVENLAEHRMHHEWYELPAAPAAAVAACRARGGRVVAVGTTSARVLETRGREGGRVEPGRGETDLFIYPGYRWLVVDVLLTNFHLPRSTLLMLVCALAGHGRMLAAYREAVARDYRFFSYGDACWIEKP